MTINFPLILASLTVFTGVIVVTDFIITRFRRRKAGRARVAPHTPITVEYARAFFPVLLIVFVIRSFFIQPYRVPTGSLEPTVIPGDFILVNQYEYGVRLPIWDKKLKKVSSPKRGQIALFYYPVNRRLTFVKRVIGLPGDKISYVNKQLSINGKPVPQKFLGYSMDYDNDGRAWKVAVYEENLNGVKHKIYIRPNIKGIDFYKLKVPKGHYFMMGDNRDNSEDSRYWGFVPEKDLIGRAMLIWMSWDSHAADWLNKIRWHRIGDEL